MKRTRPQGSVEFTETPHGLFLSGRLKDETLDSGAFVLSSRKRNAPDLHWELRLAPFSRTQVWDLSVPLVVRVHPNSEHYLFCERRCVLTSPTHLYPEPEKTLAAASAWNTDTYRQGLMIGAVSCLQLLEAKSCVISTDVDVLLEQNLMGYAPLPRTPYDDASWAFYHGFQLAMASFRLLPEGELFGRHGQEFEALVMSALA